MTAISLQTFATSAGLKLPGILSTIHCIQCHSDEKHVLCSELFSVRQSQGNDCVKCHMPRTGTFDIPHVVITDHHIRITQKWKEKPKSTYEIETGDFLGLKCMSSDNPNDLTMARAWLSHYEKFLNDAELLDSAMYYLKKLDPEKEAETWMHYYFLSAQYKTLIDFSTNIDFKKMPADLCYYTGQSYYNRSNYKQAASFYKMAVEKMPFNLKYRNKLGTALITLGDYDGAKKEFESILNENPEMHIALNNLAFVYLYEKDFKKAEYYINKTLAIDPDYINAHLNKVKIMFAMGKLSEADSYLQKLLLKFPGNTQIRQLIRLKERYFSYE